MRDSTTGRLVRELSKIVVDLAAIQRYAQENLQQPDLVQQHGSPRIYWSNVVRRAVVEECLPNLVSEVLRDYPGAATLAKELQAWKLSAADKPVSREFRQPPARNRYLITTIAIGTSVLSAGGAWWLSRKHSTSTARVLAVLQQVPQPPSSLASVSARLLATSESVAPQAMIPIQRGSFMPGTADSTVAVRQCVAIDGDEAACKHWLSREAQTGSQAVAAFLLDATEVTNQDVASWLSELLRTGVAQATEGKIASASHLLWAPTLVSTGLRLSAQAVPPKLEVAKENARLPVSGVTWFAAKDYCEFHNKRLPTALEWEYAARGPSSKAYVWDGTPGCSELAFGRTATGKHQEKECPGTTEGPNPVAQSSTDRSWAGVFDLGANVSEWVGDRFTDESVSPSHLTAQSCASTLSDEAACRIIKGGSFADPLFVTRPAAVTRGKPSDLYPHVGFRCAKSITEQP